MLQQLSLRTRLVLGVVVLSALGLVAADVATYHELRSFLVGRVDATLQEDHIEVQGILQRQQNCGALGQLGPDVFVRIDTADQSRVLCNVPPGAFGDREAPSPPKVPAIISLPSGDQAHEPTHYLTVPAMGSGDSYRLRASLDGNAVIIVGESLHNVDVTLHRLLLIELLVTAAVLAGLAALALWVVRVGLRPLRAIEDTAEAIAAGDLSRRVEHAEPRTEVGRLGLSLNAMLGQIETAFNARAASEARLRRFIADASHELRTPLAAVRAYSELFNRGASARPNDLARSMEGIERESQRMGVLVDDLLLLARLDEGRPLERTPVELDAIAREAVETARTVDQERRLDLDAEPAVVLGDHDRLRQVLDNLLANVRAHTPEGTSARVSVRRDGNDALLEVHDEGPGLSQDDVDRVFERFYRADSSRARSSGGTGLGLSIVAAVVEALGGSVSVASEGGTTFTIRLPLDPNDASRSL